MNDSEKGSKVPQLSDVTNRLVSTTDTLLMLRDNLFKTALKIAPLPLMPSERVKENSKLDCNKPIEGFLNDSLMKIKHHEWIMRDIEFILIQLSAIIS